MTVKKTPVDGGRLITLIDR